ncbi:GDSL esterase/lipase EXL3-like [Cucurbita pepo subsp. pepo]|uniref:GDSL esterase/lipase EXL3-like n=1 Tax=Cucurbita pepo subsp. pepo TaxID=3664 RepID=UPI000C9D8B47|nr:GDSL esterase/lipase EXL3-like [Cucurbita pepo subsp. pepo]
MVALTSSSPSALNLKNQTHKGPQHSYTYKYHPKIKGPKLHKMPPPSLNFMFFLSLLLLLHLRPAIPAITIPPGYSVPAVFVFGDSIVDTGNNNNVITQAKCNYPPYGRDFSDGRPTGRFSNGRVPSDLVADALGIKELLPPYADPNLQPEELITGVNFASGGAGFDPLTSQTAPAISLEDQLANFRAYKKKLEGVVGEERAKFIIVNSLYLVVAGSNDIANTFYLARIRQLHFTIDSYTDFMARSASAFVEELYAAGARRIGFFSTPPLGCVPSQRTLAGGIQRACVNQYNNAAKLFNGKLHSTLDHLQTILPDSRVVYVDIYNPLLDVILNYVKYGFEVADRGCCGSGLIEVTFLCNKFVKTCPDSTKYVFWDSFHPTQTTYTLLVAPIIQRYISRFL